MDSSSPDTFVRLDRSEDGIAHVVIDRPQKRNALSLAMWQRLADLFEALDRDATVSAVVLSGAGGHFCAGADISEFETVRHDSRSAAFYDAENDRAAVAIRDCGKPVIAAMSGSTVGGGLGIAMACDFRVADDTIRTGIPAAKLGILYSIFDCTLLQARVGTTNAKEILFSGRLFGLEDARRLSIADRVAPPGTAALDAAREWAREFRAAAPLSIAGHKVIFAAIDAGTVSERRAEIEALTAAAFDSEDYREGRHAFLERRAPIFKGR